MSFGLLKKIKPEKVQKRPQESPLRRVQSRQERDEEELEYYSRGKHASVQIGRKPRREEEARRRDENNLSGLKLKIPPFHGQNDPEAYLEWEKKTELVFACQNYSEFMKVRVAATEFCDYANNWWDQLVTSRRRNGENPIDSWAEMKAEMRKRFVTNHHQRELHQKCRRLSQGNQSVDDYFQELETPMDMAKIVEDQKAMVPRDDGELGTEEEIEPKEAEVVFESLTSSKEDGEILVKNDLLVTSLLSEQATAKNKEKREFYQDQLLLESKNEGVMKQGLRSIDDSADEFTERYPLMSIHDSYTMEFKVVEEVDFVFGDSAFSKPENKVKSLLAEIMKPSREVANTTLVGNLSVQTRRYSKPYELQWLNDSGEVKATKQVLISLCLENYEEEGVGSDSVSEVEEGCVELPVKGKILVARRSLGVKAQASEQEQRGILFHTRSLLQGKVCSLYIDGRRVIMLPKVIYLQLMKDFNHPFDPGIQI